MPSNSSKTLDETMATEIESLSLSSLESMRHVLDLLSDMLQAVNPSDRAAVKDEVITDLVDRCRTNQKKLMQMLTTTGDEDLLGRGLELNDIIQSLLARHDAIASGTPFPIQGASSSTVSTEVHSSVDQSNVKSSSTVESSSTPKASSSSAIVFSETRSQSDEEEEDEFAQLARRHSKAQPVTSKDATTGSSENSVSMNTSSTTPHVPNPSTSVPSNALVLSNPPAPVSTAKDQDIIDLLSITLSLSPSPQTTYAPSASSQGMHQNQIPVPSRTEGYSYASQTYPGNLTYNSYVVPWAQPQSKSEFQTQPQQQTYQSQSQPHPHLNNYMCILNPNKHSIINRPNRCGPSPSLNYCNHNPYHNPHVYCSNKLNIINIALLNNICNLIMNPNHYSISTSTQHYNLSLSLKLFHTYNLSPNPNHTCILNPNPNPICSPILNPNHIYSLSPSPSYSYSISPSNLNRSHNFRINIFNTLQDILPHHGPLHLDIPTIKTTFQLLKPTQQLLIHLHLVLGPCNTIIHSLPEVLVEILEGILE
ncbi:TOM protein 2 [Spatholobus suberectus]|nr:TOM protein 2 [Spatholobus suberectus]